MAIDGFKITETLHEGLRSLVVRANRESDGRAVVLKISRASSGSRLANEQIEHEADILELVRSESVIESFGLVAGDDVLYLILEDFGAMPLDDFLKSRELTTVEKLGLCRELADIIAGIHQVGVVHKDIKPSNFLINPGTRRVKLADFGIASRLNLANARNLTVERLEGTAAYMAPEQTGRMNRGIDFRTDIYSMGIVFYEILTGQPPFAAEAPGALVHAHLARIPPPVSRHDSGVPPAVDRIILKLLAKNAEDRYQSAAGASADLDACVRAVRDGASLDDFEPGSSDYSRVFNVSKKLYGRAAEMEEFRQSFERVRAGACELVLVGGASGVGKSALIAEAHRSWTEARICSGKFDQMKRDAPYSALLQALDSLAYEILTYNEEQIASWRDSLLGVLGTNASLLVEMLPGLRLLLGDRDLAPAPDTTESERRYHYAVERFLSLFATANAPLVLVLDDLHWADEPTLRFIKTLLLNRENSNILILGAYRDHEVDSSHPLMITRRDLEKEGASLKRIDLESLGEPALNELLADTLRPAAEPVDSLSRELAGKTLGNPFFVHQFLMELYRRGIIYFKQEECVWAWSMNELHKAAVTDNVIQLMTERIATLDELSRRALEFAACIGNTFQLSTLAFIAGETPDAALRMVEEPLSEGLIRRSSAQGAERGQDDIMYQFVHDRIQQAAQSRLDDARNKEIHLNIGRLLLAHISVDAVEERVFEITDHLNVALDLVTDAAERQRGAELNLIAGRRALNSAAYSSARAYFEGGIEFLGEEKAEASYQLAFHLKSGQAESAYMEGDYEASEALFNRAIQWARSPVDRGQLRHALCTQLMNAGRTEELIVIALEGLRDMGVEVPEDDDFESASAREAEWISDYLKDKRIAEFIDLPVAEDPLLLNQFWLLLDATNAGYLSGKTSLFSYAVNKAMRIQLQDSRHHVLSSYAYITYAMVATQAYDFHQAYELGKLGIALGRKFATGAIIVRGVVAYSPTVQCWHESLSSSLPLWMEGYHAGRQDGDWVFAGYTILFYMKYLLMLGRPLNEALEDLDSFRPFLIRAGDPYVVFLVERTMEQVCRSLRGETDAVGSLSTASVWDDEKESRLIEDPAPVLWRGWYLVLKLYLLVHARQYKEAFRYALLVRDIQMPSVTFGQIQVGEAFFYAALAALKHEPENEDEVAAAQKLIEEGRAQLAEWLENRHPEFHEHKVMLLDAELAARRGDHMDAMLLYDEAIATAHASGYLHETALSCLFAGEFYVGIGRERSAFGYLNEARTQYERWEATGVVEELERIYPNATTSGRRPLSATLSMTLSGGYGVLDWGALFRTYQALSGEIFLDDLIPRLMRIMLENAGAQRGLLLLHENERLVVVARDSIDDEPADFKKNIPVQEYDNIAKSPTNYVLRTGETVVLSDASREGLFIHDEYVQRAHIKSLLCMPLKHRGRILGVVHLENNHVADAFDSRRLELLRTLASQAAISLENATLYRTLEAKVEERTQELSRKTAELEATLVRMREMQNRIVMQEKMASLGELTAGIAHEIKNPINFVVNFSRTLPGLVDELAEEVEPSKGPALEDILHGIKQTAGFVQEHGARADRIVEGMLAYSAGGERRFEFLDFNSTVRSALALATAGAKLGRQESVVVVELIEDYDDSIGLFAFSSTDLTRVILNIVSNSYSAINARAQQNANRYRGEVRVTTRRDDHGLQLRIRDNGTGIPDNVRSKVFAPFFSTKSSSGHGIGLGLSLVYDVIVTQHGGSIQIDSEENSFTEMILRLPETPPQE